MENKTALIPQSNATKMKEALTYLDSIKLVTIATEQENENVGAACKEVKKLYNDLEKDRKALVDPENKRVKAINEHYKTVTSKLQNGERQFKNAMSIFFQAQERKRLEDQRKLEAEAEEIRRKAEEAARKEAEKVEKYREAGREKMAQEAEARMETAVEIVTETVAPEVEQKKVAGISFRTDYICEIENMRAAVDYCLDNPMFRNHVFLDIKALERVAKAAKGELGIPGIKVITKKTPIVRS